MEAITVVVSEDEFFTRQGICSLLEKEPGLQVVGQASSGEEAIQLVQQVQPRVLLLDIRMPPGINGIQVIERLRAIGSDVFIIALTNDKRVVKAVEKAGANGYLPKDKYQMFLPTIQCVAQSGSNVFISPDMSKEFLQLQQLVSEAKLSELEKRVWGLMGYKNEEIARRLHKAEGRIRNLVAELYFKLGIYDSGKVSQRMQATRLATLYGILEEPQGQEVAP